LTCTALPSVTQYVTIPPETSSVQNVLVQACCDSGQLIGVACSYGTGSFNFLPLGAYYDNVNCASCIANSIDNTNYGESYITVQGFCCQ
jgi:hypothetical protein